MGGKCGVLDCDNPKFLDGLRARERRRTKCRDTSSAGKLGLIALVGISVLPNGEKYKMSSISGRTFTKLAFATGATAAFGDEAGWPSRIAWRERRDLFPEGVASGDPDSDQLRDAPRSLNGLDGVFSSESAHEQCQLTIGCHLDWYPINPLHIFRRTNIATTQFHNKFDLFHDFSRLPRNSQNLD